MFRLVYSWLYISTKQYIIVRCSCLFNRLPSVTEMLIVSTIRVKFENELTTVQFRYEDYPPSWLEFHLAVVQKFSTLANKSITVKTERGRDLEKLAHKFENIVLLMPTSKFCIYLKDDAGSYKSWMNNKVLIGLGIGAGAIAATAAAPFVIAAAGFGTGGVAAGSFAASWMSASGSIAAGSLFATLQSAGAAGLGAAGFAAAAGAGATLGGATAAGTAAFADIFVKMSKKDGNEPDPMMPFILLPIGDGLMLRRPLKSERQSEKGISTDDKQGSGRSGIDSYKNRANELRHFFRDLSLYEFLIADYPCELKRNATIKGRIYLTQNYCCFYSNDLGFEITHIIRYNSITEITKERSAYVFSNAVQITTVSEKYFLSSFATRDKTFDLLDYLWKKTSRGEGSIPIEMLPLIIIVYGADLGFPTMAELIQYFIPSQL